MRDVGCGVWGVGCGMWGGTPTHPASLWHSCGHRGLCPQSIQLSFSLQVCSCHQVLSARRGCVLWVLQGLQITHPDHFPLRVYSLFILAIGLLMVLTGLAMSSIPWGSAFQVLGKEPEKGFGQW